MARDRPDRRDVFDATQPPHFPPGLFLSMTCSLVKTETIRVGCRVAGGNARGAARMVWVFGTAQRRMESSNGFGSSV